MRNTRLKNGLFSFCILACASIATAAPAGPDLVTNQLHLLLLNNMKQGEHQTCLSRLEKLSPMVERAFDIEFISRQVLRRSWKTMTPDLQGRFIDLLKQQIALSYASNFDAYAGESFVPEIFDPEGKQSAKHLVRFHRPDQPPLQFEYVLRLHQGIWRIANIVVDGVSDLALRSAQYRTAIRDGGITHLLDTLSGQTEQSRQNCVGVSY